MACRDLLQNLSCVTKSSSRLCHMNLGTKGQQDGVTDPSGYSSPGKSCYPPRLTPGFLLPSSLSFCFSFLCVIWNMGAVILQNVPQLENGSLSIHRLSSMAQGWGEGQQEGSFQRPRPKAPQRKKFISTQHKVSRASPPWGRRAGVTGTCGLRPGHEAAAAAAGRTDRPCAFSSVSHTHILEPTGFFKEEGGRITKAQPH